MTSSVCEKILVAQRSCNPSACRCAGAGFFVSTYSPLKARKLWIRINLFLLLWSCLLFIDLLFTIGPLERLEGTREYLTYNFGSTLVWVVEVGLTVLDMNMNANMDTNVHDGERVAHEGPMLSVLNRIRIMERPFDVKQLFQTWTRKDVELSAELVLAIYFLLDSTKVFVQWYKADSDVGAELFDTLLNLAAYFYQWKKLQNLPDGGDGVDPNGYVTVNDASIV
mmetsp:Transcript_30815/g.45607  ORF Transcript_30815/g.45607 Transcript_30815/m.45607 type:complete len:224 (+) Transcript_30815:72-743(+)